MCKATHRAWVLALGRSPFVVTCLIVSALMLSADSEQLRRNVVVEWNQAVLEAVRNDTMGPPMVARALVIVHTCVYDAWAAYDRKAIGTQFGDRLRRPRRERTLANKAKAVSFAAYRASVDLFPSDKAKVFDPLMATLGYDINDNSTDVASPAGVGNVACAAVLDFRHADGSNQLGNMTPSGVPYTDYTDYQPVNLPSPVPVTDLYTVKDPNRWQPLTYNNGTKIITQPFVGAQWFAVVPFAMTSPDQFLPYVSAFGPALEGSRTYLEQQTNWLSLVLGSRMNRR